MNTFYRTTLVAVFVTTLVVCAGCKRKDDLSLPSSEQAAIAKKESDTTSTNKSAPQPSVSTAAPKSADEQTNEAEKPPAAAAAKTGGKAKEAVATDKPKAADKTQTGSAEKKAPDNQSPTKPTKGGVVTVPQTAHVRVDIPKGLQKLLNEDSRMQPWVDKVMKVANSCYASQRESSETAAGEIVIAVTMHPNARPDAEIKSLPPQLSGMVPCATGNLMSTRMPLFTGPEGEKYTLRLEFKK